MYNAIHRLAFLIIAGLVCSLAVRAADDKEPLTPSSVIENATEQDWRSPAQANLLYMDFSGKQVVFELAPDFAPRHIENLRTLVGENYFDGLAIVRSQDNYVVQWGDPASVPEDARSFGEAKAEVEHEFYRDKQGLEFATIESRDAYADEVGFSHGFAVGSDEDGDGARAWLTHCYGTLGVGRALETNSGNSSSLYVVTGHAPRHLDRNVTLIGRVISGMANLSTVPRGPGEYGFYEDESQFISIDSIRFGDQLENEAQLNIEIMRTNTKTFEDYVSSRTHRSHEWFADSAGKIEVCNVGVPT
ncbi:MAG: peptidylprolyl isomerase, partial [Pseudomonadota bacterium]